MYLPEHWNWLTIYSTANKGGSTVNYRQSLAFDRPYLSCNDHCDRWLFQEIFFYYFQKQFFFKRRFSSKQMLLEMSQYSQENICVGVFFNKIAGLKACNFNLTSSQKRLQNRCFPENIARFLRTAFYITPPMATFVSLIK